MTEKNPSANGKLTTEKKPAARTSCDDCVYYDYDELTESYSCQMSLDEDEMARFLEGRADKDGRGCPYYKFYDEYKSVQKQN